LRTKVTKDSGSRAADLAMACKLSEAAQTRWRSVNVPHRGTRARRSDVPQGQVA
jgi:hypothetical protein